MRPAFFLSALFCNDFSLTVSNNIVIVKLDSRQCDDHNLEIYGLSNYKNQYFD